MIESTTSQSPSMWRGDRGSTLTEMLVAIGIFSVLMVIVGGAFISAFRAIRTTSTTSDVVQDERNAMLWISRAIRFADNATEGFNPGANVVLAAPSEFTFYANAGFGQPTDPPSRVSVKTSTQGIVAIVGKPTVVNGVVTGYVDQAPVVLMAKSTQQNPSVAFAYSCSSSTGVKACSPTANARVSSLYQVKVTIRDGISGLSTEQTITLANPQ